MNKCLTEIQKNTTKILGKLIHSLRKDKKTQLKEKNKTVQYLKMEIESIFNIQTKGIPGN